MFDEAILEETASTLDTHKAQAQERGWTILQPELLLDGVPAALAHFGSIIPQFNGLDTFEVTYKPGFESVPYSQSKNSIGPHTEAPVYDPPPKYLALHCHRQAKCGGGQTLLADGFAFYRSLDPVLKQWASENTIAFTAAAQPGSEERRVHHAPIMGEEGGVQVFRFSYNLFRFGDVNPSEADIASASERNSTDPLGRIAQLGEHFFEENVIPVLIPEGCVLIWDNQRLMHARSKYADPVRHLTRYWLR